MEVDILTSTRKEILGALHTSVVDLAREAELDPTRRQDANTAGRVNWVVENGRKAFRDLTTFFTGTNVNFYTRGPKAEYIWISCLFNDMNSVNTDYSQMESLEQFWLARNSIQWNSRPENILCVFAKSDAISPRVDGLSVRRFVNKELPPPEAICRSAVIALLFLLKSDLHLSAQDLYFLMAESLDHPEPYNRPQLLAGLSQDDLCLDTDSDAPWHSISSAAVLPTAFSKSSTKVLIFPGKLPEYQVDYNYMDIYQPHGSEPTAKSSCAIWGAWNDQKTSWRSIASFSNPQIAKLCENYLHRSNIQKGNTTSPELYSLLSSHWVNLLRCVYRIGVNDGRLILRNAARDIEHIKYSNSAKPSIGSANVCLMFLNHLDYFLRMTKSLCENIKCYPPQWHCPDSSGMAPPDWFQEVGLHCETLNKELSLVIEEAKDVRKMILEQHNLLESRKTSLLTILASIFVPMTFVASFFGMNTVEINGSVWKLKYYFISALPLAVLTVLIPLIILPTFNFVSRHLVAHSILRDIFRWSWIIITLVLNLYLDLASVINLPFEPFIFFALLALVLIRVTLYVIKLHGQLKNLSRLGRSALWRKKRWWFLFFIFGFSSFLTSWCYQRFVELPAYFIYFFVVGYRYRREKLMSKGKEL